MPQLFTPLNFPSQQRDPPQGVARKMGSQSPQFPLLSSPRRAADRTTRLKGIEPVDQNIGHRNFEFFEPIDQTLGLVGTHGLAEHHRHKTARGGVTQNFGQKLNGRIELFQE